MSARLIRGALSLALLTTVALPGIALAAEPTAPSSDVVSWAAHLEHMRSVSPNLGAHVVDCVASHGSAAGLFGPNGVMLQDHGMAMR